MSRSNAEAGRRRAGDVRQAALEEGRTVYARTGITPVTTGPAYAPNGGAVAQSTSYDPDKSAEFLEQAERKWRTAEREEHPADKCEALQASMERALKALIAAQGMPVKHSHELNALWTQAESSGARIPVGRNESQLEELSRYAGDWQYDNRPQADSTETWEKTRSTAAGLLTYARMRVPELAEQTRKRIQGRA